MVPPNTINPSSDQWFLERSGVGVSLKFVRPELTSRVMEVVDLVSSEDGYASDKRDDEVDDKETDLENFPKSEDFDYQHNPSDGGRSDHESDVQSQVYF